MDEFRFWDLSDPLVDKIYARDNFKCVDTGTKSNICYIFFSSNGLYYPDTREVFESVIIDKDRYEWTWIANNSQIVHDAGRIIYVRDIHKRYYVYGISKTNNTIDKVLEQLKELTKGYHIRTIGTSAGGYMAAIAAVKLKAEYCIDISGTVEIEEKIAETVSLKECYRNITKLIESYEGTLFYFYASYCDADMRAYNEIKSQKCVKPFSFGNKAHADTMFAGNFRYIIDKNKEELVVLYNKYKNKVINKYIFLFMTVPKRRIPQLMLREIKSVIRRNREEWQRNKK